LIFCKLIRYNSNIPGQVSISSTFYARIFCTKVLFSSFVMHVKRWWNWHQSWLTELLLSLYSSSTWHYESTTTEEVQRLFSKNHFNWGLTKKLPHFIHIKDIKHCFIKRFSFLVKKSSKAKWSIEFSAIVHTSMELKNISFSLSLTQLPQGINPIFLSYYKIAEK